jgi:putative transposase
MTDEQYAILGPRVPGPKPGGRPRTVDIREVINAILYLNRTGCQWRALPHDFPKKGIVSYYYYKWIKDGTWERLMQALREQVRVAVGKEPTPSMAILDSQSVKGTETGGERGYDGNKKINGRKRHLLVDTLGLVLVVVVTGAGLLDGEGAQRVLAEVTRRDYPRLRRVLGDQAYGKCGLPAWVRKEGDYVLDTTPKIGSVTEDGFPVFQWRWIVERTIAWIGRYRRHSKDYERNTESSEAQIQISSIHRMLQRLKPRSGEPAFRYPRKQRVSF